MKTLKKGEDQEEKRLGAAQMAMEKNLNKENKEKLI
jgi:hypothetical protein